ncbi:MAG TPA: hypothetical protein VES01_01720 [Dermatophilaceae bacterium]|nr:hypothetical protein [Dermatophilaceae bacterium]
MSQTWTWTYHWGSRADSAATNPSQPAPPSFPTQADAEAWLGECWADLLADGVDAASLRMDDHVVYGPMSLHDPA